MQAEMSPHVRQRAQKRRWGHVAPETRAPECHGDTWCGPGRLASSLSRSFIYPLFGSVASCLNSSAIERGYIMVVAETGMYHVAPPTHPPAPAVLSYILQGRYVYTVSMYGWMDRPQGLGVPRSAVPERILGDQCIGSTVPRVSTYLQECPISAFADEFPLIRLNFSEWGI